jgi:hypothetical protein
VQDVCETVFRSLELPERRSDMKLSLVVRSTEDLEMSGSLGAPAEGIWKRGQSRT